MSYLMQVLSSVEEMELEQINTKCPEVAVAVDSCKNQVVTYLENLYVRFSERPRQNKALAVKISQLQEDVTGLIDNVKQITRKLDRSEGELATHADSLAKTEIAITLVSTIYKIHESLLNITELRRRQEFLACVDKIKETDDFCKSLNLSENLPAVRDLSVAVSGEKASVLNTLSNMFNDNVILQAFQDRSVLQINENDSMDEVLSSLYRYRTSVTPLDNMIKFLWNNVFIPLVDYTVEVIITTENTFKILTIKTMDSQKKATYVEVFANIRTLLEFLSANFNVRLSDDMTTLSYIGRDIRDNLSELLIKHCLHDTIPTTAEGLQKYSVVIEATSDLEQDLVKAQIFAEDTMSILEYANNVDVLFINKKCQDYVNQAQTHMIKDLHDLVEVGTVQETQNRLIQSDDFDHCSVSRSVLDVLVLLENVLREAVSSSDVCAGRLFCTVRTICQKYIIFVPERHKKLLQTIPQQVAVFYNNCQYISFKLNQWNDSYLPKLPSLLSIDSSAFNNEAQQVANVGAEMFTSFVENQISQIEQIMKDSELSSKTLEQVNSSTEKCIRQCLRQQELLKTVWLKVLPYSVYNKTLGKILNVLCNCIMNAVVRLEDISSTAAGQLVELFKIVQTRGPKLFSDHKEVSLFVTCWYKWNELVFVLNASLLDINDRWADGKGPLALQIKPEELKQLIRALFQNTQRRAALLTKIHN